mmetsp:Transcript_22000/g.54819  ORF Transcript_22000/g.54819 Transcript_22000/m.54819 type:complete len:217 (-) Transcript_22000:494-1144(-)
MDEVLHQLDLQRDRDPQHRLHFGICLLQVVDREDAYLQHMVSSARRFIRRLQGDLQVEFVGYSVHGGEFHPDRSHLVQVLGIDADLVGVVHHRREHRARRQGGEGDVPGHNAHPGIDCNLHGADLRHIYGGVSELHSFSHVNDAHHDLGRQLATTSTNHQYPPQWHRHDLALHNPWNAGAGPHPGHVPGNSDGLQHGGEREAGVAARSLPETEART